MKILLIASSAPSLRNFRGALIEALIARGAICHDVALSRAGLNPVADLRALVALCRLMRRIRPGAVLAYTIKPVIWGMLAAWAARVPRRYALVTGLGYAFTGSATGKRRVVQTLVKWLYRRSLRRAHLVFFQNNDDPVLFRQWALLRRGGKVVVVNGSGVDTDRFAQEPLPDGPLTFLLIARLLGDKGIREYAEAARILRPDLPEARFHLVGGHDPNPDAIPQQEVAQWQNDGILHWHGALTDVRPAIAAAHVYVLPSYREGTPRTVLEAMSMGRAVITTDAPGCRETVRDGHNGFLVPVRDAVALAEAMRRFADTPDLIASMGRAARRVAVEKYDVHKVNAAMIEAMDL